MWRTVVLSLTGVLFSLAFLCNRDLHGATTTRPFHTFEIGSADFLLDNKTFQIRSGEMHAARIPREYWRHRLQMAKAMGCNTVCAYLFWGQHEPNPGVFDFSGQADAAEYCRIAQEVGLWIILRPGPYACAEWDFGGFPWWLLKTSDIKLRTRDPRYLEAVRRYLLRVGQILAPLQITRGGPIIMVQVENEYGSYGTDREYIAAIRDYLKEAGFNVPLFTCDGPEQLKNDVRDDIFCVVNFGSDPAGSFKALRQIRPQGPLMCGEYYPGWFDSWGKPHHTGDTSRITSELEYMLAHDQSFSIYMVHGGTSFGFSSGANSPPYSPQSTSYDYDAPIDEAGRPTPKYRTLRDLMVKHLPLGETLPDVPAAKAVITIPTVVFDECAPVFDNLGKGRPDEKPRPMETYDQAHGCILYRTTLPPGPAGTLTIKDVHDIAQVFLDHRRLAVLDRRYRRNVVNLAERRESQRLDILVEAMGRVNYGADLHDRKGITQNVQLSAGGAATELTGWEVFCLPFDADHLARLTFTHASRASAAPTVYRAAFDLAETGDTFLDMRGWAKGMVWVNGHNLGRYWRIGPQQTLYLPGCWLKKGRNEILVLDVNGSAERLEVRGVDKPILNEVRPDPFGPDRDQANRPRLRFEGMAAVHEGSFPNAADWQVVRFKAARGRYLCLETLDSQKGDPLAACAELYPLDDVGLEFPRPSINVALADSEESSELDGSASNVVDLQAASIWQTRHQAGMSHHPHYIVFDLGSERSVGGIRYLPRQDSEVGRIRNYRIYLSAEPFPGMSPTPN